MKGVEMGFAFRFNVIILFIEFVPIYHLHFFFFFSSTYSVCFVFGFIPNWVFLIRWVLFFVPSNFSFLFSFFCFLFLSMVSFFRTHLTFSFLWGYPKLRIEHNLKNITLPLNRVRKCLGRGLRSCGDIYKQRDTDSNWVNEG